MAMLVSTEYVCAHVYPCPHVPQTILEVASPRHAEAELAKEAASDFFFVSGRLRLRWDLSS